MSPSAKSDNAAGFFACAVCGGFHSPYQNHQFGPEGRLVTTAVAEAVLEAEELAASLSTSEYLEWRRRHSAEALLNRTERTPVIAAQSTLPPEANAPSQYKDEPWNGPEWHEWLRKSMRWPK